MYAGVCTACVGMYVFVCGVCTVSMHVCTNVWVHVCLSVGVYVSVCGYIWCMYVCTACVGACGFVCGCIWCMHVCMYVACVGVYVSVCGCVWCPCMCVQDVWVRVYGMNRHMEDWSWYQKSSLTDLPPYLLMQGLTIKPRAIGKVSPVSLIWELRSHLQGWHHSRLYAHSVLYGFWGSEL